VCVENGITNSSLSVRCSVTNVGAVINRPAVTSYVSTLGFDEFVTSCCRADDIRPYGGVLRMEVGGLFQD